MLLIVVLLVAIDAIPEIILLSVDAVIYSPTILKQQKDDYFNSVSINGYIHVIIINNPSIDNRRNIDILLLGL